VRHADESFGAWLQDRKNRRQIPQRLESTGYLPVRNPNAKDDLWVVTGSRCAVYARAELAFTDRLTAARQIAAGGAAPQLMKAPF
jgi:hypothetical protein